MSTAASIGLLIIRLVFGLTFAAPGYWITANGSEYNVAIITTAIGIMLTGPGCYALDGLLFG